MTLGGDVGTSAEGTPHEPLVSVLTPFYNTERYLAEAIESVLAQTYRNFEYILVNNRSTDGSLAIAEQYAQRDPRIRVRTNAEFLSQDMNCSEAFRQISAESEYCKMVLADDVLFPRCLEEMVAVAQSRSSVGAVGSYYLKGTVLMGAGLDRQSSVLPGRFVARLHLQHNTFVFGTPSTIMYRSQVVRQCFPFYDPAVPHADTEAAYRTCLAWDFGFVHQVLSFLRVENDSRMGRLRGYFPHLLDKFIVVTKFGPQFLNEDEYRHVYERDRDAYFRHLGRAVLTKWDPAFWEYHRAGFATVGYELRRAKLWRYSLRAMWAMLISPWQTIGLIFHRLRGSRHGDGAAGQG